MINNSNQYCTLDFKLTKDTLEFLKSVSYKTEDIIIESNGFYFSKRNGKSLCSRYNPVLEAEKLVDQFGVSDKNETINIFGGGLFYHVVAFVKKGYKVRVFEADLELLKSVILLPHVVEILDKIEIIVPHLFKPFLRNYDGYIFHYKPSICFNPEFYHFAESSILMSQGTRNSYRVLLVGPLYGGSLPVFYYCDRALKNLGHDVISIDFSPNKLSYDFFTSHSTNPYYQQKVMSGFIDLLGESIVVKALENKVDIVLGIAQSPFNSSTLERLKNHKIVTAFWFVEDFRTLTYWKNLAPHFDFFFGIQKDDFFSELNKIGVKEYYYLPMAADPETHRDLQLSQEDKNRFGSDISFVGAGYYNRMRFFPSLLRRNFKIWGDGWTYGTILDNVLAEGSRRVSTEESIKIFNATKFNINLHSSSYTDGVNPNGDFVNPRTFELASAKCFQLVDNRSLLTELFETNEMVTYNDEKSLDELIDFYSSNAELMDEIVRNSYNRVISSHTYEKRMCSMLSIMEIKSPILKNKNRVLGNKSSLIFEAEENNYLELANIFRSIDKNNITMDDLSNYLNQKNYSDFDKTDKILRVFQGFYDFAKRKNLV
ncbi:MAG: glycosyltransferase [Candidatus Delongbacteria bacterium]|nr:glycosyltransferase [Candidatus Delongbacteria bacterium]MBN2834366.1 glycosyltransferase [Candidatus Delongbacteria bacterium]